MFRGPQWDSLQAEGPDLVAAQAFNLVAQRQEQQPDLPLLAVVHVHVEVGRGAVGRWIDERGALHLQALALVHDTLQQQRNPGEGERLFEDHVVAFHDHVRRMHQAVGQVAVGGENHEALAVLVEAACAEEPILRVDARDQFEDRGGVVRIVVGADETPGLVHGQGQARLGRAADGLASAGHAGDARHDFLSEGGDGTVDPDLALRDHRLRLAARADPGISQVFLEANFSG